MAAEKKRRQGGRSAAVLDAVFAAARELYRAGEELPTLAQVALRAGVQKTTVYRRWPNVETLLHEAMAEEPRRQIGVPNTGSLREDLRSLARAGDRYLKSDEGRSMQAVLMRLPDAQKQRYWAKRYSELRQIYERAIGRGEIDASTDIDLYLDLFNASTYFALWAKGQPLPLSRKYQVIEVMLTALRHRSD